ncbi:DHA2 family efflux MFS transporter permease subunit [Candidatus Saccharibacteria bacterium]|nr:DHA2 family efflux MFS transporter permease subunit [Candidatus Saccharibacteria bacterium]
MERLKKSSLFRKWLPLIVLSSALMIIIIDTTVLNVSIRNMLSDLHTNVQGIQWVISAYSLTLAALTVTGGRLGDLFGRKKMFRIGAVLFAVGSLITSLAPTIAWVIIGNAIVEGIGAALMMPATASLLVNNYRGKDRALAFAIWGSVAASAAAIGPILGGWLTTNYSWRWAFRINLVVVVLLLLGSRFIKEARERAEKRELDLVGILLSSVGLTSIVYGLIESSTYGWVMAKSPFALWGHSASPFGLSVSILTIILGLVIMGLFGWYEYRHEQRGHTPLVSLALFKNRQFTAGSITTALLAVGQTGLIFAIPIFYQSVLQLDAFHTGLGLLPMSLAIMVGAPSALKLTRRLLPKQVIQLGFLVSVLGVAYLFLTLSPRSTPWDLAPGLFVYGLGMGFGFSQLGNLTLSAVSVQQSGEASGVNNTIRQIGASFGSAIIGAALIATLTSSVVSRIESSPVIPNDLRPAVVKQVKEAGSNIEFANPSQSQLPADLEAEIVTITHESTVKGNKVALLFTGGFALMALAFSSLLPSIRDLETGQSASAGH